MVKNALHFKNIEKKQRPIHVSPEICVKDKQQLSEIEGKSAFTLTHLPVSIAVGAKEFPFFHSSSSSYLSFVVFFFYTEKCRHSMSFSVFSSQTYYIN